MHITKRSNQLFGEAGRILCSVLLVTTMWPAWGPAQVDCIPSSRDELPLLEARLKCKFIDVRKGGLDQLRGSRAASSRDIILVDPMSLELPDVRTALKERKGYLCVSTSGNFAATAEMLQKPITSVRQLAIIPDSADGVRNVWNLPNNIDVQPAVDQMSSARRAWTGVEGAEIISAADAHATVADGIRSRLRQPGKSGELTIIFGHNEKGSVRCPDGSFIDVPEVQRLCLSSHRVPVVLSCDTASSAKGAEGILVTRSVSYRATAGALMAANQRLSLSIAAGREVRLAEYMSFLEEALAGERDTDHRKLKIAVSVALGLVILVSARDLGPQAPSTTEPSSSDRN